MAGSVDSESATKLVALHYLVSSYLDLKDVVETVETMITSSSDLRYPTPVRKQCQISVTPLKATSGFVIRISVPETILDR